MLILRIFPGMSIPKSKEIFGHLHGRTTVRPGRLTARREVLDDAEKIPYTEGGKQREEARTVKVELKIDPAEPEARVVVHAPAMTEELRDLLARLETDSGQLPGFREDTVTMLDPAEVLRFYGEDKAVLAQTAAGTYQVRMRLYELEERLTGRRFVRISHSEIVNLRQVTALDLGLTGTIRVTLTGGVVTYASRRYVKKIKEALGI